MNKKYLTFFLTWFNKFLRVPYPGALVFKNDKDTKDVALVKPIVVNKVC